MKGKRLPIIPRVEISIVEESNPRLLSFEKGAFDYITVPGDLVSNVTDLGNGLQPRFAKAGVKLARGVQPAINYTYFNMEDAVIGGYTQERIALAARDSECPTTARRRSASSGRARPSARRSRYRPACPATIRNSRATSTTTSPARRRSSTSSATSIATATAGATCPTASRW